MQEEYGVDKTTLRTWVKAEMLCPMKETGDGYIHIFMGEVDFKLSK